MRKTLSEIDLYASMRLDYERIHRRYCDHGCFMPMPTAADREHEAAANWVVNVPAHFPEKCRYDVETVVMDYRTTFDVEVE